MVITLDRSNIETHVHGPGIALINWRDPDNVESLLFDQTLERTSEAHRDVRFGSVDVRKEGRLAREYAVGEAPKLMVYRDGILVFSRPGLLPDDVLDSVVEQVSAVDMDEVRKSTDGQSGRVVLAFRPGEEPTFEIVPTGVGTGKKGRPPDEER